MRHSGLRTHGLTDSRGTIHPAVSRLAFAKYIALSNNSLKGVHVFMPARSLEVHTTLPIVAVAVTAVPHIKVRNVTV
jgi:hypothetical protein